MILDNFLLFTEIPTEKMIQMQGWVEKIWIQGGWLVDWAQIAPRRWVHISSRMPLPWLYSRRNSYSNPVSRQPSIWSIDPTFRHCYWFSVNRKYFIISCIDLCAQKQYVDFKSITDCPPEGRSDVRVNCRGRLTGIERLYERTGHFFRHLLFEASYNIMAGIGSRACRLHVPSRTL